MMLGCRTVTAAGIDFELNLKYEMIEPIGHGAYGTVISALDRESNSKVGTRQRSTSRCNINHNCAKYKSCSPMRWWYEKNNLPSLDADGDRDFR